MAKTDFLENELLDHVLGAATYTPPVTIYCALYTAAPSDAGGGTEVSGTGYARVAITNNATNFPAASGGSKSNGTAVTFPTAGGSWGTVTYFGYFDASSGGNLLRYGALGTSKVVGTGDTPSFAVGALVSTED